MCIGIQAGAVITIDILISITVGQSTTVTTIPIAISIVVCIITKAITLPLWVCTISSCAIDRAAGSGLRVRSKRGGGVRDISCGRLRIGLTRGCCRARDYISAVCWNIILNPGEN